MKAVEEDDGDESPEELMENWKRKVLEGKFLVYVSDSGMALVIVDLG